MGATGSDAASVATRKNLAERFDSILDAINGVVNDSGYAGKNLVRGNGKRLDATTDSKIAINNLRGIDNAHVTNVKEEDQYRVEVQGTGTITGNSKDIADTERDRGIGPITVTGRQSSTQGNFNPISIETKGAPGRDKKITVGNPPDAVTVWFTQEQWKNSKASGTPMTFDHTFNSGARVVFDVDFDRMEAIQPNYGEGLSTIEKTVDLQIKVTNGQDLSVTRDANAPLGAERLANGENAFEFPSGTVRLNIDEKTLAPLAPSTPVAGNLSEMALIIRSNPTYNVNNRVGTSGDVDGDGVLGPGDGFEIDFRLTNNTASQATSVSYSNAIITNIQSSAPPSAYSFLVNTGAYLGDVNSNQSVITNTTTDLDFDVPTGAGMGDSFMITMNVTSDGQTRAVTFGPFVLGSLRNGDVIGLPTSGSGTSSSNVLNTKQSTSPGPANDLFAAFDVEHTNGVTVESRNLQVDGQGLQVDHSQNEWRDVADVENAVKGLETAEQKVRGASQALTNGLNIITTRSDFTKEFSDILNEGANRLTEADQNEEGCGLLMLRTRQSLSQTSLSIGVKTQNSILSLF